MAWSSPLTAVSNAALTAAQWNASVRDNLNETAPAKATTAGRIFVATGANAIAERAIAGAYVGTDETTTSTTYADLATGGPAVTLTTGTQALVWQQAKMNNSVLGGFSRMSYAVSGASAIAAADNWSTILESGNAGDLARIGTSNYATGLTSGSNVFTLKYNCSTGTSTFGIRHIAVMAL